MTEYWKSQARKYCEFCKCWFADNKVSISFHENGKRHKESVQKHISTLTKKSTKDLKQKEKMDDDIKKMEKAAMAAYLKDVQNNADLTSQSINEMVSKSIGDNSAGTSVIVVNQPSKKSPPVWNEVKNDDGSSYFWNTVTNETTWDPPDEYLSNADQEKDKLKDEKQLKKQDKAKKQKQKEAQKEALKEVNAHLAREKMRELAVKKDTSAPDRPAGEYGPAPRAAKPYGSWTPVVNQPAESADLQLPAPRQPAAPPPVLLQPESLHFGEKRVHSLGDEHVEFKVRKFNNNRKNIRQKINDD